MVKETNTPVLTIDEDETVLTTENIDLSRGSKTVYLKGNEASAITFQKKGDITTDILKIDTRGSSAKEVSADANMQVKKNLIIDANTTINEDMIIHKNIVSFDSNDPINIFKNLAGGGEFTSTITLGGDGSNVEIHELNIGGSYGNSGTKLFSNGDIKSDGILIVDDESTFKSNLTIYGNILAGETTMDKEIFATRSDTLGPTNGTITIGSDGTHVKVYYLEVGEAGSKAYIDNQGKITAQDLMVKGDIITTVDEDKNIFTDVSTGKSITIGVLQYRLHAFYDTHWRRVCFRYWHNI